MVKKQFSESEKEKTLPPRSICVSLYCGVFRHLIYIYIKTFLRNSKKKKEKQKKAL